MGFSVHVQEHVIYRAHCGERGCDDWHGQETSQEGARREADQHVRDHQEAWARLNREWEREPLRGVEALACPAGGEPVQLVTEGLEAGLYRCDLHGPLEFEQAVQVRFLAWAVQKGNPPNRRWWHAPSEAKARETAEREGGEAVLLVGKDAEDLFDLMDAAAGAREEAMREGDHR